MSVIDIKLLQIMKHKKEFVKLVHDVPNPALDDKTRALLKDFEKYFNKFPDHDVIDLQVFLPRFKGWHPGMTDEQYNTYLGVLRNIVHDVDEKTKVGILGEMHELTLGTDAANVIANYDNGDLKQTLSEALTSLVDAYKLNVGAKNVTYIDTPIEELLEEELNNEGIKWRLDILNEHMRPMRGGDFGIVAGRPDRGKTTFLTSEVTFMAGQLPEDKNILWLNNEGPGRRIIPRLYQSALGMAVSELIQMKEKKTLGKEYRSVVGRLDKIRIVDIHGMHVGQVEAIIENSNAGIVIYDMIDHIRGFNGESRTDLQLEEMYKWGRERAVKYDHIGIATSQISAEGEGLQFPLMSMLKDSKTGKQGACDFLLMIGASNDTNLQYSRYLSLPKNKLRREGKPGDPRAEVKFKPTIARYEDIGYGT